jgi:transposase
VLYFVDAAHFVFGPFLGILWCFQRLFVQAPSGRQRLNVLAALNAISHELITVTNLSYINSKSVCELLSRLAAAHLNTPITVVLDNARYEMPFGYQRCALVQQWAEQLGIELLFLPPYSPNLNLIERFWKFVKKQCLYSRYYPDASAFQQAILSFIAEAPSKHQQALNSLLTPKFQTFTEVPLLTKPQSTPASLTLEEQAENRLPMAA